LVAALVLLATIAATVLFDSLFEEPGARSVPSLVNDLGCRSVLGVFAHPDDEILVSATLADAAQRDCEVRTVTATRGERGVPRGFAGTKADLVQMRDKELRRFGTDLGIREQLVWDFPDGDLSNVRIEILRDSVLAAIRRFQPDLILTMDSTAGFTGHVDHRRIGAAVLVALHVADSLSPATRNGSSPRWLAQVTFPRRAALFFPAAIRHRLHRQPSADVAAAADPRFKLQGMKTHASQQQYFPPRWLRLMLYHFYDREHFALTRLDDRR
jgi:LmbE family N-acetylglucosaminyl deacetylase